MSYSVISIEDGVVVLEDENGALSRINISVFPNELREGQIVDLTESGYEINSEKTSAERRRIFEKFNSIKK